MRTFITLVFLLSSLPIFSQEGEIRKHKDETQTGKFIKIDGEWERHGIWKSEFAKARYNNGKLVWVQPKGQERYTYERIRMEQLSRKVERLETRLASNK
jgi:hypothetical protein